MATTNTIKDTMLDGIAALTTPQIIEGIEAIGGGRVDMDQRMLRAYMIEELIKRDGVVAGDELMDKIGM